MPMIEDNNEQILKLGSILHLLHTYEVKYLRAQWKVSYYRKIRAAIRYPREGQSLPSGYFRWKKDPKGLDERLKSVRMQALRVQEEKMRLRKQWHEPLKEALANANAALMFNDGELMGFAYGPLPKRIVSLNRFEELAHEYEASKALNEILDINRYEQ